MCVFGYVSWYAAEVVVKYRKYVSLMRYCYSDEKYKIDFHSQNIDTHTQRGQNRENEWIQRQNNMCCLCVHKTDAQ